MAGPTDFFIDKVLGHFRGTPFPAPPANWHVSLHSADPGRTGANEIAAGGYARKAIAATTAGWSAPANSGVLRLIDNLVVVTFGPASEPWGTVLFAGIWDAAAAGNCWWSGPCAPAAIDVNDTYPLAVGTLDLAVRVAA